MKDIGLNGFLVGHLPDVALATATQNCWRVFTVMTKHTAVLSLPWASVPVELARRTGSHDPRNW